jgi:hypothetical protein
MNRVVLAVPIAGLAVFAQSQRASISAEVTDSHGAPSGRGQSWVNYNETRLDYAAALSRISVRYQQRF